MKKRTRLELSKISLGHLNMKPHQVFVPKAGKGISKKRDRRNWKNEVSKAMAE